MVLNRLSKVKKIRLTLFLFGIMFTTFGWAVENATNIPIILKFVSPKYVKVSKVFENLDKDEKNKVLISDEGSKILVEWWEPKLPTEMLELVTHIGRATSTWNILTNVHSYDLRLITGNDGKLFATDYTWESHDAKLILEQELRSSLFRWGTFVFWIGLFIMAVSGFWEFFGRQK